MMFTLPVPGIKALLRTFARALIVTCMVLDLPAQAADVDLGRANDKVGVQGHPVPFLPVDQLQRTLFTAREGAPQGIYAITQDPQGYLWVGGSSGLYRFDGVRFEKMFEDKLPAILISALFADKDGSLWIGDLRGGITRLRNGVLTQMNRGRSPATIMAFTQRTDGALWVGTASSLDELDGETWRPIHVSADSPKTGIDVNLYGKGWDGSYWVFSDRVAYRRLPASSQFERFTADEGMAAMAGLPASTTYSSAASTADMIVDRYRALWVPTIDGLLRVHVETSTDGYQLVTERVRTGDGSEEMEVTAAYSDRDGNVWIASSRGLEQFRATRFTPLSLPAGTYRPTIAADDDGALWVASLSSLPPLRVGKLTEAHPEFGGYVACLARAPDGAVWLSADSVLHRYHDGLTRSIPLPHESGAPKGNGTPGRGCAGLAVGTRNDIWLDIYSKLWHWDGHEWNLAYPKTALSLAVQEDRVWVGRPDNTLVVLEQGKEHRYTKLQGIDVGAVSALYSGKAGLWMGGNNGLMLKRGEYFQRLLGTHGERFLSTADIVELDNGDLWILTSRGAYRVAAGEIKAAIAAPSHAVGYELFDQDDGLRGSIGTVQLDPLEVGTDGRLWIASQRSVAWIDPTHIPPVPAPPPVSIDSLNGKDLRFADGREVMLEKGARSIDVAYTAATLSLPGRSHFRYVLHGIDDGWQDAGTQRSAHYSNLGPGHYIFLVEASSADGVWPASATRLSFEILPAFYQTWWFKGLCILAALLVAWSLYRMHISRIFASHQARVRERERIARDLHDSLLQYFQALLLHAHAATSGLTDGVARVKLEKVIQIAGEALVEGRDKIMELRSVSDSLDALPNDIARLAQLLGDIHAMEFSVEVHGELRPLRPAVADEVHAISHELVANAFRHSQGTHVRLDLYYERQALVAVVTDDGRGIDGDSDAAIKSGHWGIAGMHERAKQIGGSLAIGRGPQGGTRATLKVPARLAYSRHRGLVSRWR
ncbi:signal transduction histidine kinase [Luteibacter rhizovicinus]|uniref:Signal transduction histidine kinase n=1 Tax=Luteibacter rhizovicinus TaxID=242606 RepID=A0A4R3YSU0_9GAMM|nr:sensor histidine kinase [Luteibacter rhizovicinus]TCV95977.1 signal transduction histidine kinase [Luteibacter rhizovicinus]